MPIERKKGKAEPKDVKTKQDSFDEANPHLEQEAIKATAKPNPNKEVTESPAKEFGTVSTLRAVNNEPDKEPDPFVVIYESDMSSIYALQVGNGCIVKTIHADQVNVTFVPGATIINGVDGKFKLKGRN